MSDNKHMRQFTATPTVEELEAEIERLNQGLDALAIAYRRCSGERAKLQAVVNAAELVDQYCDVTEGNYFMDELRKALAALKGADDE